MKLKSNQPKATAEQVVKDIRRATRRHYSTEDKIRIVLSGLRGKKRLAGDTARAATSDEVLSMRSQTQALKEAVADLTVENRLLS
jgi:transposase